MGDAPPPGAPPPGRRSFVGSLGWALGGLGIAVGGYTLFRSAEPVGHDPRVKLDLPDVAAGYFQRVGVEGRPVGVRGLSAVEAAGLQQAPGAPPFLILDLACTHDYCVVASRAQPIGWACPCCGSLYDLVGRPTHGLARRPLAIPPYSFIGRRTVLIGKPFVAG